MTVKLTLDPNEGWPIYGEPVRGRSCGGCQSCCTLVPVERPLNKPTGVRCIHQRAKGCGIYEGRPDVCRYWSCAWLYQEMAANLRRPDKCGYIVDPMLQEIIVDNRMADVAQVWIDPARPEAHRAPELRDYLRAIGVRYRVASIVRWCFPGDQTGHDAMVLVPPELSVTHDWVECLQPMIGSEQMAQRRAEVTNHD